MVGSLWWWESGGGFLIFRLARRCRSGNKSHVAQRDAFEFPVEFKQRIIQFDQHVARQIQRMLVRLIGGSSRIIDEWRAHLLDVSAKDMCDRMAAGEIDQTLVALDERREIGLSNGKTPGIKAVAGQENSGGPIIQGDTRFVVSGNGNDIDDSSPKIDVTDVCRPMLDAKRLLDFRNRCRHELNTLHLLELGIAGDMITVSMRMNDDQGNCRLPIPFRPLRDEILDNGCRVHLSGASVLEQRTLLPKDQIQE